MPRALMWLNLYGCEAVRCKLKNSLETQKMQLLSAKIQHWKVYTLQPILALRQLLYAKSRLFYRLPILPTLT